tara:strand:- start:1140 stop:1343 length:204 start_codon:yes stop_codon:yes gene_type:complete
MTFPQQRDEITEKCAVYLSNEAWQKHFMRSVCSSWAIEIHESGAIIEGLDDCGRCRTRLLLPIETVV